MVADDLVRDGREALAAADWERARERFAEAVEREPAAEALDGLGWALLWLADYDGAVESAERAFAAYRERELVVEAAEQARRLAFLHGAVYGNDAVANGWFARAARLLGDVEERADHGWLAFEQAPMTSDRAERERLATTALTLARRYGDRDLEFSALALLGETRVHEGRVAEGMALIDEAMAAVAGGEVTGIVAVGDIYCRLLGACERATDARRAEQWMAVATRFAERTRSAMVSTTCRLHYGGILVAVGRWSEAEEELLAAISMSERSFRAMRTFPVVRLADLRARQGRFEDARRLIEGLEWHPVARQVQARIALASGEAQLAEDLTRLCLGDEPDPFCAPLLELLVQAQLMRGALGDAAATVERLDALAAGRRSDQARGHAQLAGGRLLAARGDDRCVERLQAAAATFAVLDLPLESARAALALGAALADASPAVATEHARAALATFEGLGAMADANAAAALLRRLGAPGRVAPRGDGALTPREEEVLALLARGLSNADIAARLVISRRTAEHHVASILAKLGLRSRAEAAAYAVRAGRTDP
jgi:DNA-binding NarL/FixJ family response regulator